jgi:hypothetical protein
MKFLPQAVTDRNVRATQPECPNRGIAEDRRPRPTPRLNCVPGSPSDPTRFSHSLGCGTYWRFLWSGRILARYMLPIVPFGF